MPPMDPLLDEWGEDELIRNDDAVERAEQGQYQRYPYERSPGDYKLRRQEIAKEVRFEFIEEENRLNKLSSYW